MSLFDSYDPSSPAIVDPDDGLVPIEGFPETLILTFHDRTVEALERLYRPEVVGTVCECRSVPVYRVNWAGRELGLIQTLVGGAGTAGVLEEALVQGAKKVLLYGACGVLDGALAAGRLILPTAAYRDEGVSYHYLPVGDYVDVPTAARLGEIFDELQLPYVKGRVWTTDGFYRETRSNMEKRRAEGCIAVDMECASAMAVGQFRGVPVYQFLYAEDSLAGEVWDERTTGRVPMSEYERYLRIALEIAVRL